ncbi:DUF805 domain-containing protein [Stappia sp. GBMRC 2046]|uniref:DUF805 domain-containing protein n=1 Tax=Stappia sediminis TaxID=2692190 RepID=A0A7X3LWG8_9HYPH|nr:DUF805 domain-containing protein [Stappia sediminis]MXN66395.1 DUF805 domain-containing protein [Stappia sediminis]
MSQPQPYTGRLSVLWLLFNPIGRVSREPYWLGLALIWTLMGIPLSIWMRSIDFSGGLEEIRLADFMDSNPLIPILLFVAQWVMLALVIKRLQDRGLTGLLAILIFIPVIELLFVIALGLMPSQDGPNRYGPYPNSRWQRPGKT